MISVGIKELKNQLSEFLKEVKSGQVVLITQRGKIVAKIVQQNEFPATTIEEKFVRLGSSGFVQLPKKTKGKASRPLIKSKGAPASQWILNNRR